MKKLIDDGKIHLDKKNKGDIQLRMSPLFFIALNHYLEYDNYLL